MTQEGLKIIKEIWNHSPREPDVQDYIARKGPKEKPRLLKSGWHPKCDAVYFWIFEHTSACSCGSSEGSRGFQITWKQTGSFSDDVLLTIKDSSQALVSSPLWGELWVKCLNNPDSGPQLIPYQATEKSYANMEYPFPPEWVYTLFYNYPSLTVMKFLIDRLIGLTSIKQKIFYNDGILYLWNGAFWNNFRDSCDTLSMIFNYYFGLIEKHFLAKLNLTDSTSVDSEETFWAKHFLGALRSLVQKSWGCKLPKKYLRDKYQAPVGL